MAFCRGCGQDVGGAAFCPKCGAAQGASSAPAAGGGGAAAAAAPATAGMEENVAGLLAYLFGWITGLIFLLVDKRTFVKFKGAQAIALDIGFAVFGIVLWILIAILTAITIAIFHFPF